MPIYDYVCSTCRTVTEVIHGINDPAPRFCPSCGADGTLRKAMVSPAIHFKGSGWAKKDRSSSSGTKSKAGTSSSGDSADSGGSSHGSTTDSKKGSPSEGSSGSTSTSSSSTSSSSSSSSSSSAEA